MHPEFHTLTYRYDSETTWGRLFPFAALSSVMYVAGIPLLFVVLLASIRGRLLEPGPSRILGFMYWPYKPKAFAFELVLQVEKCIIVLITVLFSSQSPSAAMRSCVVSMVVTLITLLIMLYFQPFKVVCTLPPSIPPALRPVQVHVVRSGRRAPPVLRRHAYQRLHAAPGQAAHREQAQA